MREAFTFSTQPLDETDSPAELTALFETPGLESMLLFSSDYPHYDADDPAFVMGRIPESMRPSICYQNAVATFGEKVLRYRIPRQQAHSRNRRRPETGAGGDADVCRL